MIRKFLPVSRLSLASINVKSWRPSWNCMQRCSLILVLYCWERSFINENQNSEEKSRNYLQKNTMALCVRSSEVSLPKYTLVGRIVLCHFLLIERAHQNWTLGRMSWKTRCWIRDLFLNGFDRGDTVWESGHPCRWRCCEWITFEWILLIDILASIELSIIVHLLHFLRLLTLTLTARITLFRETFSSELRTRK